MDRNPDGIPDKFPSFLGFLSEEGCFSNRTGALCSGFWRIVVWGVGSSQRMDRRFSHFSGGVRSEAAQCAATLTLTSALPCPALSCPGH
jgi:hypothetical protein